MLFLLHFGCCCFGVSGSIFIFFLRWLVVIVGVCKCLFVVAMMYMSSWWSIFSTVGVGVLDYYLLAVLIGADCIRSLSCCFYGVVFIAPLHLGVNDVLCSLSDLFDFIFCYRVVVFCLYALLLKCVYLDGLCWPWSM